MASAFRLALLPLTAGLLLLLGGAASTPAGAQGPSAVAPAAAGAAEPDLDAIRRELEMGRHWHASRELRSAIPGGEPRTPREALLLARAESGWRNWGAVERVLEGGDWLGEAEGGEGWALLGRAREGLGRTEAAVEAYGRYLSTVADTEDQWSLVGRARRARLLQDLGASGAALEELHRTRDAAPWLASWLALALAEDAAGSGAVQVVRTALQGADDPGTADGARRVVARALVASGDTAAALEAFLRVARDAGPGPGAASAWARIGELRMSLGDTAAALQAFRNGRRGERIDVGVARGLVEAGTDRPDEALLAFRALDRSGDASSALGALGRYEELREGDGPLSRELRLARARHLVAADRAGEAVDDLRELADTEEAEIAAPALDLWIDVRRKERRWSDARTLQNRLVERFPARPEAVDVQFFRADDVHDRGDLEGAARRYRRIVEAAPTVERAGLARMRLGQIHVSRGRHGEAARVFEGYLEAVAGGPHWEEAAFWAARSHMSAGQGDSARALVKRIRSRDPLSYYTVLGAAMVDDAFPPAEVSTGAPPAEAPWIDITLDRAVVLRDAGLDVGSRALIHRARKRAEASSDAELLRLAIELSERGFTLEGIRAGWELRSRGRGWDRWLVRAIYPFPYRELLLREAEEWGVDPFLLAALVRQESAFVADIRSGAGAVGLMQVVPSTGRGLARSVGPRPFQDRVLVHPEVNLHLGAAFLVELQRRFGGDLPLVLAAYNAGPSRARSWRARFPEVDDPLRFTERIPFPETREYVKRVRRNVEIYRWLYAGNGASSVEGSG